MSKGTGWGREFDDPIELPDGGELVTLKDVGNYIMKLPKAEHEAQEMAASFTSRPTLRLLGRFLLDQHLALSLCRQSTWRAGWGP